MLETNETHKKIIGILNNKGPSLPIQIAKQTGLNSLFVSAFLSELANEKKIKISNLKVGGSPLYYLPGQEQALENFSKYMHPREKEAFLLLKEKKILKDPEQTSQIRVALRSIPDFAKAFKKEEEIFWKYAFISDEEIENYLKPELKEELSEKTEKILDKETKKQEEPLKKEAQIEKPRELSDKPKPKKETSKNSEKQPSILDKNPLVIKTEKTEKTEKPKSEFVQKIDELLKRFKILEEKEFKAKECNYLIQIKSELGPINFLTHAKDKKKISETDLKKFLSNAQSIPLPGFFIYTGELNKKAKKFAEEYYSILKTKKIN